MAEAGVPLPGDREVHLQLAAARELLGMELAYIAEFRGGREVYRAVDGEGRWIGVEEGASVPLDRSHCRIVAEESAPNVIAEAARETGVGSLIGVPVRFPDGRLFGGLCCVSRRPNRSLGQRDVRFLEFLARLVGERLDREQVAADGREEKRLEIEATGVGALLTALEARDDYTGKHSDAVVELALQVAAELGVEFEDVREVGQVAMLHDIGKIGLPDAILRKPGPLTEREWDIMRTHPELGARMVSSVVGLTHLAPAVRAEHERWDGTGYPDRLQGEEIPSSSRIVFACDAFHAMRSDRPYRGALTREHAMGELARGSGTQFCPATVEALLETLRCADAAEGTVTATA